MKLLHKLLVDENSIGALIKIRNNYQIGSFYCSFSNRTIAISDFSLLLLVKLFLVSIICSFSWLLCSYCFSNYRDSNICPSLSILKATAISFTFDFAEKYKFGTVPKIISYFGSINIFFVNYISNMRIAEQSLIL